MIFPFTFNFYVPGIPNPFSKVFGTPTHLAPTFAEPENNKSSRNHQLPTDSCQTEGFIPNNHRSQEVDYRDRHYPAPAYPSSSLSVKSNSYPIPTLPATTNRRISRANLPKITRRRSPSPTPSSLRALPLTRKRAWEPAFGAESFQSVTNGKTGSTTSLTLASTSGYLDPPAKYRDIMDDITMNHDNYRESEMYDNAIEQPPMKKRRGLAGSIVSTAVNAALIGTAVGLTVYRLWRDRGNEGQITHSSEDEGSEQDSDQHVPPPPYDPGAWTPNPKALESTSISSQNRSNHGTPNTHRSSAGIKGKKTSATKRAVHATRRTRLRHVGVPVVVASGSPRKPEFDFGRETVEDSGVADSVSASVDGVEQTGVEDQMDWIGDKLSMLIEQGRRALQSEVVVMSEAKEDEVDDGRGGWEEASSEDDDSVSIRNGRSSARSIRSRSGSMRKPRPKNIIPPLPSSSGIGLGLYNARASGSASVTTSPRKSVFMPGSSGSSPYATPSLAYTPASASGGFTPGSMSSSYSSSIRNGHVRGVSYETALPPSEALSTASLGYYGDRKSEDAATWESPELKASMEAARSRLLAARRGAAGS